METLSWIMVCSIVLIVFIGRHFLNKLSPEQVLENNDAVESKGAVRILNQQLTDKQYETNLN